MDGADTHKHIRCSSGYTHAASILLHLATPGSISNKSHKLLDTNDIAFSVLLNGVSVRIRARLMGNRGFT